MCWARITSWSRRKGKSYHNTKKNRQVFGGFFVLFAKKLYLCLVNTTIDKP